jgi:cytochrome c-type biogenesis protein CcmH/NrfF
MVDAGRKSPSRRVLEGTLLLVVAALSVVNFVRIDSTSHSASDTLLNWVPQTFLLVVAVMVVVRVVRRRERSR